MSSIGRRRLTAALFTSTSIPPNRSTAASTMRCAASASPRSQGKTLASSCALASVAASSWSTLSSRSVSSTEAPAAPRPAASQRPMPPAAPVTTAVLPSRENERPGASERIASASNAAVTSRRERRRNQAVRAPSASRALGARFRRRGARSPCHASRVPGWPRLRRGGRRRASQEARPRAGHPLPPLRLQRSPST